MYEEGIRIVVIGQLGVFAVLICLYAVIIILGKSLARAEAKDSDKSKGS